MAPSLTPAQRSVRARAAAFAMHAAGATNTKPAMAAWMAADERAVDPDGALEPQERARRARLHLRSRMTLLSLRASRARQGRNGKVLPAGDEPGRTTSTGGTSDAAPTA